MMQDAVLRNEWIVACRSDEVKDQPVQVTVMGERGVLFRTKDGVRAFKDLCIHRGAALSMGCIRDEKLVCPYHGWEFDASGACVKIPQLPKDQAIPTKARAIVYGCTERYGLVWVNLNNNQPKMFSYTEFDDPSFRHIVWGPHEVKAKPPRIVENFLDVGHLAVVHEGILGTADHTEIADYHVHRVGDVIRSDEIAVYQPNPDGTGESKYVYYTYEIMHPLTVKFCKRDRETDRRFSIMLAVLPKTESVSVVYGVMSFNYDTGKTDEEIIRYQDAIFAQDKPVVEHQKPEELPLDLQAELSLKCDRVSIAYRQYLSERGVKWGTA